ncbi:MAG: CDP-alcohol phosphatidyltransferase family protein [Patescibacteria group bacterium]|nr:CDP-alcohol phosphatidyltransferase family protein [Patescibacteria group bacterium]
MLEKFLTLGYTSIERLLISILKPLLPKAGLNPNQSRLLTLPNLISLTRLPIGLLVWKYSDSPWTVAFLFLLAMLSDLLDGMLARKTGPTIYGAIIDPLCDKLFFFVCVVVYRPVFNQAIFWTLVPLETLIFLAPFVYLWVKNVKADKAEFRSNIWGKSKFTFECLALAAAVPGLTTLASSLLLTALILALVSIPVQVRRQPKQ